MIGDPAFGSVQPLNTTQPYLKKQLPQVPPLQFGLAPNVAPIKHIGLATRIFNFIERPGIKKWVQGEITWGNMSPYDWLSRTMTLPLYFAQIYLATKKEQHKWETIGRNVIIWTGTLGVTQFIKSDRFGSNTLLDTFMKPKATPYENLSNDYANIKEYRESTLKKLKEKKASDITDKEALNKLKKDSKLLAKLVKKESRAEYKLFKLIYEKKGEEAAKQYQGSWFYKLLNKVRLEQNYFDILKNKALGIRIGKDDVNKTYWSSMNYIDLETVMYRIEELKKSQKHNILSQLESKELKTLSRFMTQVSTFKLLSTGIGSALTIYIVGTLLMDLVFKFIAPFDHDFNPEKTRKAIKQKLKEEELLREGKALPPVQEKKHFNSPFHIPLMHRAEATTQGGAF